MMSDWYFVSANAVLRVLYFIGAIACLADPADCHIASTRRLCAVSLIAFEAYCMTEKRLLDKNGERIGTTVALRNAISKTKGDL